jgi:hypothetical protein
LTASTISAGDTGAVRFGLCDSCRHQRIVRNTRGSVFSLCERSRSEPEYPRYPRVPVTKCAGFQRKLQGGDDERDRGVRSPA